MSSGSTAAADPVARVREALERIVDPCSIATGAPVSLREMGLIKDLRLERQGGVVVELRLTSPFCFQVGLILQRIDEVTAGLKGVTSVRVEVDHGVEWVPEMMSEEARMRLRRLRQLDRER